MIQLDASQRAFIEAPVDQDIRLLAPAGCGKTLCLLHRCKHLAEQSRGQKQRFLIVTFTKTARDELRARVNESSEFTGIRDRSITNINNLNSWGLRRLKDVKIAAKTITPNVYPVITLNDLQRVWTNYSHIQDAIQSKRNSDGALKLVMQMIDTSMSLGIDHERINSLEQFLNYCKVLQDQGLGKYLDDQVRELIRLEILDENVATMDSMTKFAQIYRLWFGFWSEAIDNLYDISKFTFEGQKYFAYQDELKKVEQGIFNTGAAQFHHILVDEFQDINPLDLALVRIIAKRNRATLTIAGDDDQAIFEWRGTTPEYILNPEEYLNREFRTYTLQVNYRSPANIVEHSQRLIKHNRRRVPKEITADIDDQALINVKRTDSLTQTLDYIGDLITLTLARGEKPSQIVLVSRLKSEVIPYQVFLASKGIPFCAAEDLNIFLSKTFKQLLGLLKIKARATEEMRTHKVASDIVALCNFVRWKPLSKKDAAAIRRWLWESDAVWLSDGIDRLAEFRGELKRSRNTHGKVSIEMATALREFVDAQSVSAALIALSDNFAGLQRDFVKAEDDFFFKDPPFLYLADFAKRYGGNHTDFVDDIELAEQMLANTPPADEDHGPDLSKYPIHLMTATRTKGKEFDHVVLLNVHDQIWPHKHAESPQEVEAERRLFYVAFTRARKQVTIILQGSDPRSPFIDQLGIQGLSETMLE